MSYILDALKKAEAERKLGAVPGVHAQPVIIPSTGEPAALWRRPAAWGSLATVLTVAVLLSWFQPWKPAPAPVAAAPASPAPAPVATAPANPAPATVAAAPANPAPGR
ncbi:MAG: hypothetical protein JWQ23_2743, partial [Herminiimonas sp.]|nr:hypothetical protein [Herminiimonas sp.]